MTKIISGTDCSYLDQHLIAVYSGSNNNTPYDLILSSFNPESSSITCYELSIPFDMELHTISICYDEDVKHPLPISSELQIYKNSLQFGGKIVFYTDISYSTFEYVPDKIFLKNDLLSLSINNYPGYTEGSEVILFVYGNFIKI